MSRRSPRTRRTLPARLRKVAAMMTTIEATTVVKVAVATAARVTVEAAAVAGAITTARAVAAAARPVAKRHWLKY
jgi:hypothetical protein